MIAFLGQAVYTLAGSIGKLKLGSAFTGQLVPVVHIQQPVFYRFKKSVGLCRRIKSSRTFGVALGAGGLLRHHVFCFVFHIY